MKLFAIFLYYGKIFLTSVIKLRNWECGELDLNDTETVAKNIYTVSYFEFHDEENIL